MLSLLSLWPVSVRAKFVFQFTAVSAIRKVNNLDEIFIQKCEK